MHPSFCIIIPARYNSSRFPGKPLAQIEGKTMIQRVYEAAIQVKGAVAVIVATDDQRIFEHVQTFGTAVLTSDAHQSGTDRCFEAYQNAGVQSDLVVNIQGDEPFILPEQIELLLSAFQNENCHISTLKKKIEEGQEVQNPNVVKVVADLQDKALYFSRAGIPYFREPGINPAYFRHLGIYAYRAKTLSEIVRLPMSFLENTEKLEQLRWLENGYAIFVKETNWQSPAVDTPEDLQKAIAFYKNLER